MITFVVFVRKIKDLLSVIGLLVERALAQGNTPYQAISDEKFETAVCNVNE